VLEARHPGQSRGLLINGASIWAHWCGRVERRAWSLGADKRPLRGALNQQMRRVKTPAFVFQRVVL
jgi:hypothetical protein